MYALVHGSQCLAGMDIGRSRDPHSVQAGVFQHLVVGIVHSDTKLFVVGVVDCPLNLMRLGTAHRNNPCACDTVD